jgi:hypothetical protein
MDGYSIGAAAKAIGVSVSTMRNWDSNGYFKADRTQGRHRRYSSDAISRFRLGKRYTDFVTSWEIQLIESQFAERLRAGAAHPLAKPCGGFSKEEVGLLLLNRDDCHDEKTKQLPIDVFYQVLSSYSAPYLFTTRPLYHFTSLLTYLRMRYPYPKGDAPGTIVMESEEVVAKALRYENKFWLDEDLLSPYLKLVEDTDRECVTDVVNNAGTIIGGQSILRIRRQDLDKKIKEAMDVIDDKTGTKEPKFVLFPPEQCKRKTEYLTPNLEKIPGCDGYDGYMSRLISRNQVLVGVKSLCGFTGYTFCPYMPLCFNSGIDYNEKKIFTMFGKKLMREGDKFYCVVNVSE